MKFSGKMCLKIILKVTKNQSFFLSLEDTLFKKPQGGGEGGQFDCFRAKILENKIKANQTQYDLGREAAKIPALWSKELDKYEYFTGEDLGYKSEVLERAKLKKDDKVNKVVKYENDLVYSSMHYA